MEFDLRLPPLTDDLDLARRHLDEYGLAVVTGVLSADEVRAARQRLDEQAAAEVRLGLSSHDGGGPDAPRGKGPNQRVGSLVNKGEAFRSVPMKAAFDVMFSHLLGRDWMFHQISANIVRKGGVQGPLHSDQTWAGPDGICCAMNGLWMLDDFTDANGATRVVPRSNDFRRLPWRGPDLPPIPTVAAEGPAGSVLFYDARLWHTTGANRTDEARRGILCGANLPWVRSQNAWLLSVAPEVLESADPAFLKRLGFVPYSLLGSYTAWPGDSYDARGLIRRPTRWLGELR